jgi:hypothetical protein
MGQAAKQAPQAVHNDASSGPARARKASVVSARASGSLVISKGATHLRHGQVAAKLRKSPSTRPNRGLPDLASPFHDRDILVIACGRICVHRKKINISAVFAGQRFGINEGIPCL